MQILHTEIRSAHWERDFGRVEARVLILVRTGSDSEPRGESLMVSVPARAPGDPRSLRQRVHSEAELMAVLLNRVEQSYRAAIAA